MILLFLLHFATFSLLFASFCAPFCTAITRLMTRRNSKTRAREKVSQSFGIFQVRCLRQTKTACVLWLFGFAFKSLLALRSLSFSSGYLVKASKQASMGSSRMGRSSPNDACTTCIIFICCLFVPPLGILIYEGCSCNAWICLALCFVFGLPGVIYAFAICCGCCRGIP